MANLMSHKKDNVYNLREAKSKLVNMQVDKITLQDIGLFDSKENISIATPVSYTHLTLPTKRIV